MKTTDYLDESALLNPLLHFDELRLVLDQHRVEAPFVCEHEQRNSPDRRDQL
jgi:hypothetical protein